MSFVGTTTPLAGAATYTAADQMANTEDTLVGVVSADQAGTLYIEQGYPASVGGAITWAVSTSYAIAANDGKGFTEPLVAPKWRVRFVNGATPQGSFVLNAKSTSAGNS